MMIGDNLLNCGSSLGLKHPFIFAQMAGCSAVWCRHCGRIFHVEHVRNGEWEGLALSRASNKCYELNGLKPNHVDAGVLADIDATE